MGYLHSEQNFHSRSLDHRFSAVGEENEVSELKTGPENSKNRTQHIADPEIFNGELLYGDKYCEARVQKSGQLNYTERNLRLRFKRNYFAHVSRKRYFEEDRTTTIQ